jgi:hypothetical protein
MDRPNRRQTFKQTIGSGIHKGLGSYWMLCKVMIPVYVIMTVLAQTPVLPWIAGMCAPLMKYLGLPGDAAMALILGMTINIYASIAATVALSLTPQQMTIVGVIILVSKPARRWAFWFPSASSSRWPWAGWQPRDTAWWDNNGIPEYTRILDRAVMGFVRLVAQGVFGPDADCNCPRVFAVHESFSLVNRTFAPLGPVFRV